METALKTGDIIKTTCHKIPLCYHFAVVYIIDNNVYVFHNAPSVVNYFGGNIVYQPLDEFIGTEDKRKILAVYPSPLTENDILQYSDKNKNRKWDEIFYNCESYVNEMLKNGNKSTQLGRILLVTALTAVITIFFINKQTK